MLARCPPLVLLCAAAPNLNIRPAVLSNPADCEALCRIRKPTEYVVEAGGAGFMGQKTELDPAEAQKRRVQARLGSAMRDGATVLIATAAEDEGAVATTEPTVIGTVDCIELPAGKGRRALGPELPRRFLIRNLWVDESRRRQGIARKLMAAAEELAAGAGIGYLSLEVNADNTPARQLYEGMGFEDLEPPPMAWMASMRTALVLGKAL
jgi:ribosomal protein S18 acetylase RimI-like enzyme